MWKEVILALIGEQFDGALAEGDEICGLTVSVRQHDDIIRIWNTNASAKSSGLLARLKEIIPKAEIRSPFYKGITLDSCCGNRKVCSRDVRVKRTRTDEHHHCVSCASPANREHNDFSKEFHEAKKETN